MFMQEERRLMLEKEQRQGALIEAHLKEQKDKEIQFMMQQYESQVAAVNEQLNLKETELAQVHAQFDQVDQQLASVSQVADRYQQVLTTNQELQ